MIWIEIIYAKWWNLRGSNDFQRNLLSKKLKLNWKRNRLRLMGHRHNAKLLIGHCIFKIFKSINPVCLTEFFISFISNKESHLLILQNWFIFEQTFVIFMNKSSQGANLKNNLSLVLDIIRFSTIDTKNHILVSIEAH